MPNNDGNTMTPTGPLIIPEEYARSIRVGADKDVSTVKRTTTQAKEILKWMQAGNTVSPLQAHMAFGCMRLSARIHDLRNGKVDGIHHNIASSRGDKGECHYYLET
jgi:hypothetical protein